MKTFALGFILFFPGYLVRGVMEKTESTYYEIPFWLLLYFASCVVAESAEKDRSFSGLLRVMLFLPMMFLKNFVNVMKLWRNPREFTIGIASMTVFNFLSIESYFNQRTFLMDSGLDGLRLRSREILIILFFFLALVAAEFVLWDAKYVKSEIAELSIDVTILVYVLLNYRVFRSMA